MATGIDTRLAVDLDPDAVAVYKSVFPSATVLKTSVQEIFPGQGTEPQTQTERALADRVGRVDLLVGGPPCQGHSDLNNHTRRDDPRNGLYVAMARAALVLKPRAVIIENVPAVVHDAHDSIGRTTQILKGSGYTVAERVIRLLDVGVPQSRRRHVLLASRVETIDPQKVLDSIGNVTIRRTVRWAIGDLAGIPSTERRDEPATVSHTNRRRIRWLDLSGELDLPNRLRPACHRSSHSYKSMYGRLEWAAPAQTVTSGFGSMGQGRYVHPEAPRTLTPHEAARLQCIPDFVTFSQVEHRTSLSRLIGNAVPPFLSEALTTSLLVALNQGADA